jgi:hypothetical protein
MAATRFAALELGLLDEGRFVEEADGLLRDLQEEMVRYLRLHKEAAKGAKGKLLVQVTIRCDDPKDEVFSIATVAKIAPPAAPPATTIAIAGETQDDRPCLFSRRSGTTDDSPRQGVLSTKDGRDVDPETGEVVAKGRRR